MGIRPKYPPDYPDHPHGPNDIDPYDCLTCLRVYIVRHVSGPEIEMVSRRIVILEAAASRGA